MLPKPYFEDQNTTIYHGDSLEILCELSGIDAVITDPPYSSGGAFRSDRVQSTTAKYVQSGTQAIRPEFSGDNRDQRSFLAWCSMWLSAAQHAAKPGAVLASFTDWRQLPILTDAVQVGGWIWRGVAVWAKGYGRANPNGFSSSCEFVVWGTNGPRESEHTYPAGYREVPIVQDRSHIAEKPVEVMNWLMSLTSEGALVVDPFMGSGTTLVAAKQTGRRAIGIEVDERSCEVAARRLAQDTLF